MTPEPRAAGLHLPYPEVPARVRAWVAENLGSPVASWSEQTGGFSPGCATRVVADDGTRAFVKAVGAELNPVTPVLFRREIHALELIGDDPLWAALRSSYDEDGWVALILEDVEGGHPDLTDDAQMGLLLDATDALSARLSRVVPPDEPLAQDFADPGLVDVRRRFAIWRGALDHLDELPDDLLPGPVREDADRCRSLVDLLTGPDPEGAAPDGLSHWDIRNDNLLRRGDGSIVFVDWGGAAVGPAWIDPLLARLERVDSPWFDDSLASSPLLTAAGDDRVTAWLLGFGCYLAWRSMAARDIGLPTINEFRRTEARRLLGAAVRRLES